jgi:hypothetical protein
MHLRPLLLILLAAIFAAACDEKPKLPPVSNTPTNTGPTTQELLTGPRTRLTLGSLPLSVRVPAKGWKIDTISSAGITLLRGVTPSGGVEIQLSTQRPVKKEDLDSILSYAHKDMERRNEPRNKIDVRTIGGNVKVLEQFVVNPPQSLITTDATGKETTRQASSVTWTIEVFVPQQSQYERHDLNFVGLTYDEYQTDKPLLTEVIDSLTFEGSTSQPAI